MSDEKFFDPKNDYAFKKVFGEEKNKAIVKALINDLVVLEDPIVEVAFLSPIQNPELAGKKLSIVDVLCQDSEGRQVIVEMQLSQHKGFEKRAQYYAAKAYIQQAKEGLEYHDLKEVVFLAIADFVLFPNKPDFKSDHVILDLNTHEHNLQDFSFTFIELPKFKKTIDELSSMTDRWCYFFNHAKKVSPEEYGKIIVGAPIIEAAFNELERWGCSDEEQRAYDQAEKRQKDYKAMVAHDIDASRAEGRAEGVIEGEAKGIVKGRAEGRIEGLEVGAEVGKIQTCLRWYEQGRLNDSEFYSETGVTVAAARDLVSQFNEFVAA